MKFHRIEEERIKGGSRESKMSDCHSRSSKTMKKCSRVGIKMKLVRATKLKEQQRSSTFSTGENPLAFRIITIVKKKFLIHAQRKKKKRKFHHSNLTINGTINCQFFFSPKNEK